jgi:hypothetical protein
MRREGIQSLTKAIPFQPFRVYVSNGETFDVHHPDMVLATPGAVHIGFAPPGSAVDVVDQVRVVSRYYVQKIESLPTPAAPSGTNGAAG